MVEVCPPRRGNRKGVVEKANHAAAQRIWRSMPETVDGKPITVEQAQARIDAWCQAKGDVRRRVVLETDGTHRATTVGQLAASEPLRDLPGPFPVTTQVVRTVSAQGLVAYAGNFYSVPPELARGQAIVSLTHGSDEVHIAAAQTPQVVLARHRLLAPGTGATVRTEHHVVALNTAAMTAAVGDQTGQAVVIDLDTYARAAHGRNTLT
jgi:hypothetical protein